MLNDRGAIIPLMALPHQVIENQLLRRTLQGSSDGSGYATSLSALWTALRDLIPDIDDQKIVAALQRLHPR